MQLDSTGNISAFFKINETVGGYFANLVSKLSHRPMVLTGLKQVHFSFLKNAEGCVHATSQIGVLGAHVQKYKVGI